MEQLLSIPPARGRSNFYKNIADTHPILTAEQEYEYATKWRNDQCKHSAQQLILSHIRFVVFLASKYDFDGSIRDDLIQQGMVGLMKAVNTFNPDAGARLITYAAVIIKSEIHHFLLCNHSIVKIATTKADRKLFFNLRKMKGERVKLDRDEVEEIAQQLNVRPKDVVEMDKRLQSYDMSFDPISYDHGEDFEPKSPGDALTVPDGEVEQQWIECDWNQQQTSKLHNAMKALPERNRQVLQQRWLVDSSEKATLSQLSQQYGVSKERIRQIETASIEKLRDLML